MTSKGSNRWRLPEAQNSRPTWGDQYDEWHRRAPAHDPSCVYIDDAGLGMFDQEDLYPHIITEFRGARVAVPLGDPGLGDNEDYIVAPLCYQPLPQREINYGKAYEIYKVKLIRASRDDYPYGAIRTVKGGRMELYCINPRGMFEWLPVPGCTTEKRPGRMYDKWEDVVVRDGEVETMVRCDDLEFEHWLED